MTNKEKDCLKRLKASKKVLLCLTLAISLALISLSIPISTASEENLENDITPDPENEEFAEAKMKIEFFDLETGEFEVSDDTIRIIGLDAKIDSPTIELRNIQIEIDDSSDLGDQISNIFDGGEEDGTLELEEGDSFSYTAEGQMLQFENFLLEGHETREGGVSVAVSLEDEQLILREPFLSTGTPVGDVSMSFGTITQGMDRFTFKAEEDSLGDLTGDDLETTFKNFEVETAQPSIFIQSPVIGTHSFSLTDQHLKLEGVTEFAHIAEAGKINTDLTISRQTMNIPTLNPTEDPIAISFVTFYEDSIYMGIPEPYNNLILHDLNLSYSSVDQSVTGLDVNLSDVSPAEGSLGDSSLSMEELKMDMRDPKIRAEIPILGFASYETGERDLEALETTIKNLEVEKLQVEENMLDYVDFEEVSFNQNMEFLGDLNAKITGLEGSEEDPVILGPNISLEDPGFVGFRLGLDRLDPQNIGETNVEDASISFNVPGIGLMTWEPRISPPSGEQLLTLSIPLFGIVILGFSIKKKSKYN